MQTLLVVGATPNQVPVMRVAGDLGHEVVAVGSDPDAVGFQYADYGEVVSNNVIETTVEIAREYDVDGALTMAADIGVPAVATVRAELGLPGVGPETARRATHKERMMNACDAAGTPAPNSIVAADLATAEEFLCSTPGPVVVKPTDSGGQKGVTVIRESAGLASAFGTAAAYASDDRVLLQEFVQGPEINVTAVVTDGDVHILSLSNRITADPPHFGIAIEHASPPELSPAGRRAVRNVATSAIEAIGIRNGIAYPQVIVGPGGPRLVEIAARIPGGQMHNVARYRSGIDPIRAAVFHALGAPFSNDDISVADPRGAVSVHFFTELDVPEDVHTLQRIRNLDEARSLPRVETLEIRVTEGDTIPTLTDATARFGYVIAAADDRTTARESAERAASLVTFV
jgi:biotin carboxylase